MTPRLSGLLALLWFVSFAANGQEFDILLKGGRVIDPRNSIDRKSDVAVKDGRIVLVQPGIDSKRAGKVIDVRGLIISPGLIDIHTHVFVGGKAERFADGAYSVSADDFCPRYGVTTAVDAGTSGWRNFEWFKFNVIDRSQTRILAFLNIAGGGMSGDPDQQRVEDMDAEATAAMIRKHPGTLVGVKLGHYEGEDRAPLDRTFQAASSSGTPVLVECHLPRYPLAEQLERMRPGDIITHSFEKITERAAVIDSAGRLRPEVVTAKERGIRFDLGHGGYGFWFSQALPASRQGLWPHTFGTDMHRFSVNAGMKGMTLVLSKFLNMGMPLPDIIRRATWNAAESLNRSDLGHLAPGAQADITVLSIRKGRFGFTDSGGDRLDGRRRIEAEMTIRDGRILWDLNGRSAKPLH